MTVQIGRMPKQTNITPLSHGYVKLKPCRRRVSPMLLRIKRSRGVSSQLVMTACCGSRRVWYAPRTFPSLRSRLKIRQMVMQRLPLPVPTSPLRNLQHPFQSLIRRQHCARQTVSQQVLPMSYVPRASIFCAPIWPQITMWPLMRCSMRCANRLCRVPTAQRRSTSRSARFWLKTVRPCTLIRSHKRCLMHWNRILRSSG